MLVDKTNFGLVVYNHANFYRFEETSSYWSVKRISVFLCFSLVNQRNISGITVYNRTVTNIENTARAVHSCNSWFKFVLYMNGYTNASGAELAGTTLVSSTPFTVVQGLLSFFIIIITEISRKTFENPKRERIQRLMVY